MNSYKHYLPAALFVCLAFTPGRAPGVVLLDEDFTEDDGLFLAESTENSTQPWFWAAETGTWAVSGDDNLNALSTNQLVSPAMTVPESEPLRVTFAHRYSFEPEYDGGVLQYSVDGGEWTTVPSTAFRQNGYNFKSIIGDGPLLGQEGFSLASAGYAAGEFIISQGEIPAPAVGASVKIRLMGAWDWYTRGAQPNWEVTSLKVETLTDTDDDGMPDIFEDEHGFAKNDASDAATDADGDGLSNLGEYTRRTNPKDPDTDDDTLSDKVETATGVWVSTEDRGTSPLSADTDGDGFGDALENPSLATTGPAQPGSDPNKADTDGDGLSDRDEVVTHHTNPKLADTDNDTFPDPAEIATGTDPLNPGSFPTNIALLGTGILGINDAADGDGGTPWAQAGVAGNVNDGSMTTRVDTFNGSSPDTFSYVGVTWSAPRVSPVRQVELNLATFFDGGWFGFSGTGPGAGGELNVENYLVEPVLQVTTDGGTTWTAAPFTSDYITVMTGHRIGGGGVVNPSTAKSVFTLTTPTAGINGIRLIGENGGPADGNGFLGVFEFGVKDLTSAADLDEDGLTNEQENDIYKTNPAVADTDGDGLSDGAEVLTHLTDPLKPDTDGDGFSDSREVRFGTDAKVAASHPANIALGGDAILGVAGDFPDPGQSSVNAGTLANVNDNNVLTRVDNWSSGFNIGYVGMRWSKPWALPVSRLELSMATFVDGGWFGVGGAGPGGGGLLNAEEHLVEPEVQVTRNAGETWETVPHTSNYIARFTGHAIGGNGVPNPSRRQAVFTLTNPADGIDGIRIIGTEGGQSGGGFLGIFELAVKDVSTMDDVDTDGLTNTRELELGTDPELPDTDGDGLTDGEEVLTHLTNPLLKDTDGDLYSDSLEVRNGTNPLAAASQPANAALSATAIIGVMPEISGEPGIPVANAGVAANINDDSPATRVDNFNSANPVGYIGLLWPAARPEPVLKLELTMATFGDGGWFGRNGAGPGAGGLLSTYLVEPSIQVTTDSGETWTTVPHTSDYMTVFALHRIGGGGQPNPSAATAVFEFATPPAGIDGIRVIGQEGGNAGGGFLGVFELKAISPLAVGSGDTDGDGQSDASEALAGTDPANAADVLKITSVTLEGGMASVTWTSVPGKKYGFEAGDGPETLEPLVGEVNAAAGATTTAVLPLPVPAPPALFLRVAVKP